MAEIQIAGYKVLIDDEDIERVNQYNWYIDRNALKHDLYYFKKSTTGACGSITLHRFIMQCIKGDGIVIDHINRNSLDNRKCNLRKCTSSNNSGNARKHIDNTSGYKGVSWSDVANKWYTSIVYEKKHYYLGYYSSKEEAAKVYDMASIYFRKEFANPTFTTDQYDKEEIKRVIEEKLRNKCTSSYIGVYLHGNSWIAQLTVKGTYTYVGSYTTELEAALARDRKAYQLLGDKARLNFPNRIAEYKKEA